MNIIQLLTIILSLPIASFKLIPEKEITSEKSKEYKVTDENIIEEINLENLQTKIDNLEYDLNGYKYDIESLTKKVDDISFELWELRDDKIYFNCKELKKGFQVLKTQNGSLFVDIKEVKPYLNGYKISLNIGNPNLVTYINPEINVSWNISLDKYFDVRSKMLEKQKESKEKIRIPLWTDTLQTKSYCSMKRLLPGIWNEIEIDIPYATLDQLERCTLSITTGTIILSKDTRIQ